MSSASSRYDASTDELVVQVEVDEPSGFDRIFTLPLHRGIEPSRGVPPAENPFLGEANGGGANVSTTFLPVRGNFWERRIDWTVRSPSSTPSTNFASLSSIPPARALRSTTSSR